MTAIPRDIFEQLIRDEEMRLKPYRDNSTGIGFEGKPGKLTIAVGRNLDDKGLNRDECIYLLNNDVAEWRHSIVSALPWTTTLDEVTFAVLVNMAHNMGVSGLLGFKRFLAALQVGDREQAAQELLDSKWKDQVGPRAHRLSKQIELHAWC